MKLEIEIPDDLRLAGIIQPVDWPIDQWQVWLQEFRIAGLLRSGRANNPQGAVDAAVTAMRKDQRTIVPSKYETLKLEIKL